MRKYLDIDLSTKVTEVKEIDGEEVIVVGRHLIAKKLLENGVATVDPLGPDNPLIFSAGPFAGSNFSNANRLSVGCKSPLTGGIKEANSGGTFAFAPATFQLPVSLSSTASSSSRPIIGREIGILILKNF